MKIKLDENMPLALVGMPRSAGHEVATVPEEDLSGFEDSLLLIVVFRLQDQRRAVLKRPAEQLLSSGLLSRLEQGLAVVDQKPYQNPHHW
ncbi:MAG: DUF5615 family PIN-like protein [Thermodesulfobacteriota bacterium]